MRRPELELLLLQRGVSPLAFSLGGGLPGEQYVLDQSPKGWSVYYSERGQRTGERLFATEEEACAYLLRLLTGDSSTRA
jgi:hypothetical protein